MRSRKTPETWSVKPDEFHPNLGTAALYADLNALDASEKHLLAELKRVRTSRVETQKRIAEAEGR